jgi:hypothetical protein
VPSLDILEADHVFTLAQWGPHAVVVWHAMLAAARAPLRTNQRSARQQKQVEKTRIKTYSGLTTL